MNSTMWAFEIACILLAVVCIYQGIKLTQERKKSHVMSHDELTGVYTWGHMLETIKKYEKSKERRYVIYTDIVGFKLVNELFGRVTGDEIIVKQARQIKENMPKDAMYCRVNNDHYMFIIRKEEYSEALLHRIGHVDNDHLRNSNYTIQTYFGIYETDNFQEALSSMRDKASLALDTVKGSMEQYIAIYEDSMMSEALHRKKVVDEFDEAMNKGEFHMFLQPQFSAVEKRLTGAEALVRRITQDGKIIPPMDFIPIYEKTGLICRLDRYMWEQAAKKLHEWNQKGFSGHISVNISPIDFKYLNVAEEFRSLIKKYQIQPGQLNIEITESSIVSDIPGIRSQLSNLQFSGFALEIDDFGSGYSSLNALKDIEADVLKIDMGFLRETDNEERSRIILNSVIKMAKKLEMPVVTEGVEKSEQVDFLTEMGCDIFQGYFFSRPISVEEYEKKYMKI